MSSRTPMHLVLAGAVALGVSACGSNPVDRGITGAALGAAAGTAGAALTRNNLGPGALVGALVGGVIGAATQPEDFYLGEPVYRRRY